MIIQIFLIAVVFLACAGCADIRKFTLEASQEDLANAAISRQIADNMASTLSLNLGFIDCSLGASIEEMSIGPTVTKMKTLLKEMGKESPQDYQRGCLLGYQAKFATKSMEDLTRRIMQLVAQYGGMF